MSLVTAHLVTPQEIAPPPRRHRPTLVIADSGVSASLVVLDGSARPALGVRFRHAGLTWRISAWRAVARAFVAEPVEQ